MFELGGGREQASEEGIGGLSMPESSVGKWVVLPYPEEGGVPAAAAAAVSEVGDSRVLDVARCVCDFSELEGLAKSFQSEVGTPFLTSQSERAGDRAYRKGSYGIAIDEFTKALKGVHNNAQEVQLLAKRSAAFAALSTEIRFRPAAASESQPLYGMDPYDLARLALKDGQRVVELFPKHCEGYLRQAFANFLLENYSQADNDCIEGLRWDARKPTLKKCLQLVQQVIGSEQKSGNIRTPHLSRGIDDFECVLCLRLLYEPVTTPCGHSFCGQCLHRSLDHSNKCPFCRTVLHLTHDLPVSVALKNIIRASFPHEYGERQRETEVAGVTHSGHIMLPLFVLSTLMPGEKMSLNIFEPRYRLMIRRVMCGSRRFGMAQVCEASHDLEEVACECEITECEPLPDGRFYLEVIGRRRIRLLELWEQDGYRMGKVEYMSDDESQEEAILQQLCNNMKTDMLAFLQRLRRTSTTNNLQGRIAALLDRVGEDPVANDPEAISFWVACLLPGGSNNRIKLLQMKSTCERLQWLREHLAQLFNQGR